MVSFGYIREKAVSKYDGKNFTNFLVGNDFNSNVISKLLIDSKNVFWVGTWNGVFKFDGEAFHPFQFRTLK
jgi:ligand-binding sensor domain-containing protein